jgi:hypothetical protein
MWGGFRDSELISVDRSADRGSQERKIWKDLLV